MFRFEKEQKKFDIGGVTFGGQPGENPTVLIGTMFYNGHKILESRREGRFDKKRAEELINRQEVLSDQTGMPGMLDLVANSAEEIRGYIDFVTDVTDMPFSTDIWTVEPKLGAARYVAEMGLQDRHLYNSIAPWSTDPEGEVAALKEIGLKNALLVAFNQEDPTPDGRISLIQEKLLPWAVEAGFENVVADTSVMSIPSTPFSLIGSRKVKEILGIPVGCAPSNGTDMVKKVQEGMWGKLGFAGLDAAAHAIGAVFWNDFLMYGPIESAPWIFPAMATAESMLSTFVYDETGYLPEEPGHPLNKLYSDFVDALKGTGR
ncbi:MAG: tetrahydromethanopterin S-methyltransferase subunit H [Euryarchaeota archaeon]|nr:tetrahydromethanopterin S-methyltransferase subunit H [Euryarchaeota archaeon]